MASPLDAAPALASQLKMIWDKLDALPTFGWARVTQVDPLLILRAGDPVGSDVTAIDLIGGLTVGDQVFVVRVARRFFALGRVGGGSTTLVQHGTFNVNVVPAGAAGTSAITFQTPFPTVPDVQVTSGDTRLVVEARGITTTGFDIGWRNVTSGSTSSARTHLWRAEA